MWLRNTLPIFMIAGLHKVCLETKNAGEVFLLLCSVHSTILLDSQKGETNVTGSGKGDTSHYKMKLRYKGLKLCVSHYLKLNLQYFS